jgi:hypothetical protein
MSDTNNRDAPLDLHIEEGGWQKPVSPPTSMVRPAGLPRKPAPAVVPAPAGSSPVAPAPPASDAGES